MSGLLRPRNSLLLVTLAVLLTHGSSLAGSFVWDDTYNVEENLEIQSLTNIPNFFIQAWGAGAPEGSHAREKNKGLYRPLTLSTYALDHAVYGMKAWGFHLTNLLFHLCSSLLILVLLQNFLGAGTGLCIALIWSIHPVHTEAISVISYRTTLMAGLLGFASLYIQTFEESHRKRVWLRTLFFTLACFAKEDGVIFAAVLGLHDLVIRKISFRKATINAMPLVIVALLFFGIRASLLSPLPYSFYGDASASLKTAGVMQSTWLYTSLLAFPYPLTPFYDWSIFPIPSTWINLEVILGALISLTLVKLAINYRQRPTRSYLAMCLLFSLLPYSHILPFAVGAGERFIYVPAFFALALIGDVVRVFIAANKTHNMVSKLCVGLLITWLLPMSAWSAIRHSHWQSQLTITQETTAAYPNSFNAWKAYGDALYDQGQKQAAVDAYAQAATCMPLAIATIRQAEVLVELGQKSKAMSVIRTYLEAYGPQVEQLDKAGIGLLKNLENGLKKP